MKILMCIPNISEGRDLKVVEQISQEIRKTARVKIQNISSNAPHNRTVFTFLGPPEPVLEAAKAMAKKAFSLIDMTRQKGSHPRMGAVDVVPFIPLRNMEIQEAVEISRSFGRFVAGLGVPVYYYADSATRSSRTHLEDVRKGEYEGLAEKLKLTEWKPDEGEAIFNPIAGVTITGARFPHIFFNVTLRTKDRSIAEKIADAVRFGGGGYRYVQATAMALEDKNLVQVSMTLTHYDKTPIPRVFETIRSEAGRYGVQIAGSELVGPVPMGALEEILRYYLQAQGFSVGQILENALMD